MMQREEFMSRVSVNNDGCWIWQGSLNRYGYGSVKIRGRSFGAHRVSYELHVGLIPDGLQLDHLCRVRRCVNPAHLEPVTRRENILRGENHVADQARQTHCIHGHALTEDNLVPNRRGTRECRSCAIERKRRFRARRKSVLTLAESTEPRRPTVPGMAGTHRPPDGQRTVVRRPHPLTPAIPVRSTG